MQEPLYFVFLDDDSCSCVQDIKKIDSVVEMENMLVGSYLGYISHDEIEDTNEVSTNLIGEKITDKLPNIKMSNNKMVKYEIINYIKTYLAPKALQKTKSVLAPFELFCGKTIIITNLDELVSYLDSTRF